jgi:hypothetical protein
MSIAELGRQFGFDHRTVAAHLALRLVPMRQRGLDVTHVPKAVRLYDGGMTLMDVGLRFGGRWPRRA